MHQVTKCIEFCYGHRLLDYDGKCAHPHGHNGKVFITLSTDKLDHRGMVWDFGDIKRTVKPWIDKELDHVMILRKDDPLVPVLKEQNEPMFLMDINPTAETLAEIIFKKSKDFGLPIISVEFFETPDSSCIYTETE
jgi:6-pyruvoyltetrahydropterin/6-carboxytetrahydropterin synthase